MTGDLRWKYRQIAPVLQVDAGIPPHTLNLYTEAEIVRILHLLSLRANAMSPEHHRKVQEADKQSRDAVQWLLRDKG